MPTRPVALPVLVENVELNAVMDEAFFGEFSLSPHMHSHPYCEVIVAVRGRFSINLLNGEPIVMRQGDLCIIPPEYIHSTCLVDPEPQKLAVRFSYRKIKGDSRLYMQFEQALCSLEKPLYIRGIDSLCDLLLSIRTELAENQLASEALVQSLLQQFFIHMFRLLCRCSAERPALGKPQEDNRNLRYYTIETWLAAHYTESVTENDLAERLSLSKRQTSRILRELYGMSFREKLIEIRLHNAVQLLTQTDCPVEKISFMVGYTTPSGFYTAFSRKYGVSASVYRKQFALKKRTSIMNSGT